MTTATVDLTKLTGAELLSEIRASRLAFTDLAKPGMLPQLQAVFAEQEREKAEADKKAQENSTYSVKIGRSGTVSVSGFGRYPMSHYAEQWLALARLIPGILEFIKVNEAAIKERVDSPVAETEANPSKSFKLKLA